MLVLLESVFHSLNLVCCAAQVHEYMFFNYLADLKVLGR